MVSEEIKRENAIILEIKDILNSNYVKEDGWKPNYIDTEFGKVARANVIGTVTAVFDKKIVIDDSTGELELRSFEENSFNKFAVGEKINTIGKPREFNNTIYLVPEIIKKINNPDIIEHRKLILSLRKKSQKIIKIQKRTEIKKENYDFFKPPKQSENMVVEEESLNLENSDSIEKTGVLTREEYIKDAAEKNKEDKTERNESDYSSILKTIEELDTGDGVYIDEIISKLNTQDCEKRVRRLLEKGDIFEVRPDKVKVL